MTDVTRLERWRADPVAFIEEALIDPETGEKFTLYLAEEAFLREAFTLTADGRLRYPEMIFSAPKKSGKTGLAAMVALYATVALGGPYAETYCLANDEEQASSRVFRAASRIVEASPLLRAAAKLYTNVIEFPSSGATITALASDYAGAAGANPTLSIFDELWGYTSERAARLWDEMVPVPTRTISGRLVVSHAGFSGEGDLLFALLKRGLAGAEIAPDLRRTEDGLLMYWTHECRAPWQTPAWREQMRASLRPNQFLRMIENRFVSSESTFVDMGWWDACVDPEATPMLSNRGLPVWVGVDASTKRDSTAIVACAWDGAKIRVVAHRIFQPSKDDPLDFEATIEETLLELRRRFAVRAVAFDPYQMAATSQRLSRVGVPMREFPQTTGNLTAASQNLFDLVKGRNLVVYPDDDIRKAVSRAVAIESSRGWRISKERTRDKIDVVVALAMAALAAVEAGASVGGGSVVSPARIRIGGPFSTPAGVAYTTMLDGSRGMRVALDQHGRWVPESWVKR